MRILVIEDEPRILGFLTVGLEAEGFAVDGAEDGVSGLGAGALRAVRARRPRPAAAAARRPARARGAARGRPELPVLILSARTDLPTKLPELRPGRERLPVESRSRSTSSSLASACTCAEARARTHRRSRVGWPRARPRPPPGARRRPRHRSLRPRVPSPVPPRRPCRRGGEPRAAAVRGLGLQLRSRLERRRRLRPATAQEARACVTDRDRAACGLPAGCRLAGFDVGLGRSRAGLPRGDGRIAVVGDDPVPRDLDQPDLPLRLPRLVDREDVRRARGRGDRDRRVDLDRRVRRARSSGASSSRCR